MYNRIWHTNLRQRLIDLEANDPAAQRDLGGKETLLLKVELGLYLLEFIERHPVTSLWQLFSLLPPTPWLQNLTQEQRNALANGRVLLRFGLTEWEECLREYRLIPAQWRCYELDSSQDLEQQPVRRLAYIEPEARYRLEKYAEILQNKLDYAFTSAQDYPINKSNEAIFTDYTWAKEGPRPLKVTFPGDLITAAANIPYVNFSQQQRPRCSLSVSYNDLLAVAQEFETRQAALGLPKERRVDWCDLMQNVIRYQLFQDGQLLESWQADLQLTGMVHLPGMVGSGKTMLMKLLAGYGVTRPKPWRLTLVVGDVMTALGMAEELNLLLWKDKTKPPVTVPLIGRTTRHKWLSQLYSAKDFHGQHTGLRWLTPICLVQSLIPAGELDKPIPVGQEPCERLEQMNDKNKPQRVLCPLFSVCPARQLERDMPMANIWITTPGAMGQGSVSAHLEGRRMKLGELVYLQSDLVIFDEIDAVQNFFDSLYAPETLLATTRGQGVLDKIDPLTAEIWANRRTRPKHAGRWIYGVRRSLNAIGHILNMLHAHITLTDWIEVASYFSAYHLLSNLSLLLYGLSQDDLKKDPQQLSPEEQARLQRQEQIFKNFKELLDTNLSRPSPWTRASVDKPVPRLVNIVQQIVMYGGGGTTADQETTAMCQEWLEEFAQPDIEHVLRVEDPNTAVTPDKVKKQLKDLALCLELALSVTSLDRDMAVVFNEQANVPDDILSEFGEPQELDQAPQHLHGILPVPPTSPMFGFKYTRSGQGNEEEAQLSFFQYPHIGRWYVMNYHRLLAETEREPGPNVLALSGTSYNSASAIWHFDIEPQASLVPPPNSQKAIAQSEFRFLPQYRPAGKRGKTRQPVFVSGTGKDREANICKTAELLVSDPRPENSHLVLELAWLKENWPDRARELVLTNSYRQAEAVANVINHHFPIDSGGRTYYLKGSETRETDEPYWQQAGSLLYSDVTRFGYIEDAAILVAPLMAIGRGHNILNENRVAAFGSIYFLTRPMYLPHDVKNQASHLNRFALDLYQDEERWRTDLSDYEKFFSFRSEAYEYWNTFDLDRGYGYKGLSDTNRADLAGYVLGLVIQACGRLLRGGVPFRAFFVDAAWAENQAKKPDSYDTPQTSLLAAMIALLETYCTNPIGQTLYQPLYEALRQTKNFRCRL